ncbi:ubiquinol-cytochrome C reductase [Biscogniauxia mediterranea]|nr:ubiquinol-cytochrome C reductase [Biscogniauxia mediterranea]
MVGRGKERALANRDRPFPNLWHCDFELLPIYTHLLGYRLPTLPIFQSLHLVDDSLDHTIAFYSAQLRTSTPYTPVCSTSVVALSEETFIMSALYNNLQMLGFVFVSAFAFELAYDTGMNKIWDNINRGRQWKDIRSRYVKDEEEE